MPLECLDDVGRLKDLLVVVFKLLMGVKEELDTVRELDSVSRICKDGFQGSDNDIRSFTGF